MSLGSSGTAPPIAPPPTRRRNHYERRLQIYLVRQFRRLVDPLEASLAAIENGEDRSAETLDLLHALGVLDGMVDLVLLLRHGRVRWIEIKLEATLQHKRTGLTGAQRDLHALFGFYGHTVDVVRNAAEFWAIVDAEGISHAPRPPAREQLVLLPLAGRKRLKAKTA